MDIGAKAPGMDMLASYGDGQYAVSEYDLSSPVTKSWEIQANGLAFFENQWNRGTPSVSCHNIRPMFLPLMTPPLIKS